MTRPLRREDGRLDSSRSAVDLERQVRAYQPWPGAYLETAEGRLIVWRAGVAPEEHGDVVGRIVGTRDGGIAVATGEGRLVLETVQRAGGRPMAGPELRRGRPDLLGGVCEPVAEGA